MMLPSRPTSDLGSFHRRIFLSPPFSRQMSALERGLCSGEEAGMTGKAGVFMSPCGRKWTHHRVRREDKCSVVSMYRGKLTAGRGFAEEVAFGRTRMRPFTKPTLHPFPGSSRGHRSDCRSESDWSHVRSTHVRWPGRG
ncbi:uncharacterized protein LOC131381317 [Hylobates moloch]|uniref:uncharacterized protein LOC131381317 n=1 Tax=Hylobates moloch TaxID=81572 RepID=UPI00267678ED|nr:uncharacterized protein LOC131381317 [Hylobates moloch]